MEIAVLGSGSGGNCTYLAGGSTRLLVDAGFGIRSLKRRLTDCGLQPSSIDALLITHGHSDHVAWACRLSEQFGLTVYVNEGTFEEVPALREVERCVVFQSGDSFQAGDFVVQSIPVPHDSSDPVCFRLEVEGIAGLVATDFGRVTPPLAEACRDCSWLVLESNHDEQLLRIGPYPWQLKRRVSGGRGHLSNRALADFLSRGLENLPAHLLLAHLSRQNNLPELALETAVEALSGRLPFGSGPSSQVHLTDQYKPSIVIRL